MSSVLQYIFPPKVVLALKYLVSRLYYVLWHSNSWPGYQIWRMPYETNGSFGRF